MSNQGIPAPAGVRYNDDGIVESEGPDVQMLILTELRKHTDLLSEIAASIAVQIAREDTQNKAAMSRISITPATGAAASGLPG